MSNIVTHLYPVVVEKSEDGVGLYFPDIAGTAVLAADVVTAIKDAKSVLIDRLLEYEHSNQELPNPSNPEDIELNSPTDQIVYIEVYLKPYRDEFANKAVTKNCTLPRWLRDASENAGLNFSLVLQNGLKEALRIEK